MSTHDPLPPDPRRMSTHGPTPSTVEAAKRKAAYLAVDTHFPASARAVGIGSGSTVVYVVERIVALGRERTDGIVFVPTGYQSRELLVKGGLRVGSVDEDLELDVVFDGADEVDPWLNCIKGGGACLFQEKLVAIRGKKFVCVADFRKISSSLSTKYKAGVPIEVVPPAATYVLKRLLALGSVAPKLRMGGAAKAGPCITDNGNFIIDAPFPAGFRRGAFSLQSSQSPRSQAPQDEAAAKAREEATAPVAGTHSGAEVVLDEEEAVRARDREGAGEVSGIGRNEDVEELARVLKGVVGVVEHGLFWSGDKKPVMAYFGMEDGDITTRGG